MKKIAGIVIALVVVVGGLYYFSRPAEAPAPEVTQEEVSAVETVTTTSATFDTADGQHMIIVYDASGDNAVLNFRDQQFILARNVSASGARYSTADGVLEFWEHQGEATVTLDNKEYTAVLAQP